MCCLLELKQVNGIAVLFPVTSPVLASGVLFFCFARNKQNLATLSGTGKELKTMTKTSRIFLVPGTFQPDFGPRQVRGAEIRTRVQGRARTIATWSARPGARMFITSVGESLKNSIPYASQRPAACTQSLRAGQRLRDRGQVGFPPVRLPFLSRSAAMSGWSCS